MHFDLPFPFSIFIFISQLSFVCCQWTISDSWVWKESFISSSNSYMYFGSCLLMFENHRLFRIACTFVIVFYVLLGLYSLFDYVDDLLMNYFISLILSIVIPTRWDIFCIFDKLGIENIYICQGFRIFFSNDTNSFSQKWKEIPTIKFEKARQKKKILKIEAHLAW